CSASSSVPIGSSAAATTTVVEAAAAGTNAGRAEWSRAATSSAPVSSAKVRRRRRRARRHSGSWERIRVSMPCRYGPPALPTAVRRSWWTQTGWGGEAGTGPGLHGSGGRCGGRRARGAAGGGLRGGARVSGSRPGVRGRIRLPRGLRAARSRRCGAAGGRGVGGVEAGALEDDADRVEDLAQRVLRAFGTGHQRVLAEALVLLESVFAALAGVDVGGH